MLNIYISTQCCNDMHDIHRKHHHTERFSMLLQNYYIIISVTFSQQIIYQTYFKLWLFRTRAELHSSLD